MIYSSLAVLALSASAVVNPFTHLVHMHPKQPDTRVNVTLYNKNAGFCEVKIEGHIYTVNAKGAITVKAPVGTVIYAASRTFEHKRGDMLVALTPSLDNQRVTID
jgi:hypothetical protein